MPCPIGWRRKWSTPLKLMSQSAIQELRSIFVMQGLPELYTGVRQWARFHERRIQGVHGHGWDDTCQNCTLSPSLQWPSREGCTNCQAGLEEVHIWNSGNKVGKVSLPILPDSTLDNWSIAPACGAVTWQTSPLPP